MSIIKVVNKYKIGKEPSDFSFWQSKSYEERIDALEQIRQVYNDWRYPTERGLQRVYKIIKRNKRPTGRAQDMADMENLK